LDSDAAFPRLRVTNAYHLPDTLLLPHPRLRAVVRTHNCVTTPGLPLLTLPFLFCLPLYPRLQRVPAVRFYAAFTPVHLRRFRLRLILGFLRRIAALRVPTVWLLPFTHVLLPHCRALRCSADSPHCCVYDVVPQPRYVLA